MVTTEKLFIIRYLEAKKNKKRKGKKEENIDFPGREEIKFGDVVQAPPKLVVPKVAKYILYDTVQIKVLQLIINFPCFVKALKNVQDASKERVRVKAIEAYRQRKGWNARPGIQLPPPVTSTAL